jgi:hypothetical protein
MTRYHRALQTAMRSLFLALLVALMGCSSSMEDLFDDDQKAPRTIPPRADCTRHLGECLGTSLQSVKGGSAGSSRCMDCADQCPDALDSGGDCRWWMHE